MSTVLICGGRRFSNRQMLKEYMDAFPHLVTQIITGGAPGADSLAEWWAEKKHIPVRKFRADWESHGKKAGPLRNQQMLDEGKPDYVVAFPGGLGTADMIRRARKADIEIFEPVEP